jgi:ABC-type polysaccharide/polyol phosphate transport system ATPase subunit
MTNAIELNHVWKKFKRGEKNNSIRDSIPAFFRNLKKKKTEGLQEKEFWAVHDVNFTVKKGEVVGIIGPNGAGKSTTLKLLSGILMPTQGTLKINGRLSALIEVTAGFHPDLTGRENVYLNGTILGMKKKEIDDKFEEIVDFSGIREFIDTPVKRYSSGMMSRLGFSVAAHIDPEVLLVDEVLAVGDIAFQSKCAQKMRELLKSGVTIAIVSHNLPLIQSLCQRVILINRGQVVKEGSPNEVIPFYENLMSEKKEEELREKLKRADQVKPKDKSPLTIHDIKIVDQTGNHLKNCTFGTDITVKVEFEAHEKIESPIFVFGFKRADGILCCISNTKRLGMLIGDLHGKGTATIHLGKLSLTPNVYIPTFLAWDRDMLHAYAIRENNLFRIDANESHLPTNAIFFLDAEWEVR